MSGAQTILTTLVLYVVALLAAGLRARARARDPAGFLHGARSLGPFVAALSASASSASAWSLLGVSGAAYRFGLGAVWLLPACVGGFVCNWWLLAPRLRRLAAAQDAHTLLDMLAGPRPEGIARTITRVGALIILLSLLGYVAAQLQGAGKTFAAGFGVDMRSGILIGTAVILIYTVLGGLVAVNLTDALQGVVMAVAAVILPIGAVAAVGGPVALFGHLSAVDVPGFSSAFRGLPWPLGLAFAAGLLGIGLGYPGQPHVINRLMAVRDERALKTARLIALAWAILIFGGMLLLGWSARIVVPTLSDPELALLEVTRALFPPVMEGLAMAAILSAAVSTADSQLLVATASFEELTRLRHPRIVLVGLCCGAVAAAMIGSDEIFSRVLFSWAAMGAAFGPSLFACLYGVHPTPRRILLSMVVGFTSSVAASILAPAAFSGVLERVVPFALAALILAAPGSKRFPPNGGGSGPRPWG